jgi:peroxiredoxin
MVDTMKDELNVGSPAPDFSLLANNGREIGLADYRDRATLVLFFVREYV